MALDQPLDQAAKLPKLDISQTRGMSETIRRAYHAHQATAVVQNGFIVGVLIPLEEYHDPGTCCCKNCPWNGNHQP